MIKNKFVEKFIDADSAKQKTMLYELYSFLNVNDNLATKLILDKNNTPSNTDFMYYENDRTLLDHADAFGTPYPYSTNTWNKRRENNQAMLESKRLVQDYAISEKTNAVTTANYSLYNKRKLMQTKIKSYIELNYFNTRVDLGVQLIKASQTISFLKNNVICSSPWYLFKYKHLIRYTLEMSKTGKGYYIYQYKVGKERHTSKILRSIDGNDISASTEFMKIINDLVTYRAIAEIFDYDNLMNYLSLNKIEFDHIPDVMSDGEMFFLSNDHSFYVSIKELKKDKLKAKKVNEKIKFLEMREKEKLKKPDENIYSFLNELMLS